MKDLIKQKINSFIQDIKREFLLYEISTLFKIRKKSLKALLDIKSKDHE